MNKIQQKYSKLFKKFYDINNTPSLDIEYIHIIQDKIYREFIKDISRGNFSKISNITHLAKKNK
jgi:hypothetical protein